MTTSSNKMSEGKGVQGGRMQCLEVWGGNQQTDRSVETVGLHIWVHAQPYAAERGGDVYYISSCASGRITRLLLADVSGHGEAVSSTAIALRDLMRRNVNIIRQTRFARSVNEQFSNLSAEGGFATAVICTFFGPTQSLQISSAGHPECFLWRRRTGRWQRVVIEESRDFKLSDIPFGVDDGTVYSLLETRLATGDLLLCYSDALIDALESEGRWLGVGGLEKLIQQIDGSDPGRVIPELLQSIRQLHPENLNDDDVTVLLLQATGRRGTLRDNLLAPFRLLRGARARTQLAGSR